jgi:hypothetical protein
MTAHILHGLHQGRSLPVLIEQIGQRYEVRSINGHLPEAYPPKVGNGALAKLMPRVPVVSEIYIVGRSV